MENQFPNEVPVLTLPNSSTSVKSLPPVLNVNRILLFFVGSFCVSTFVKFTGNGSLENGEMVEYSRFAYFHLRPNWKSCFLKLFTVTVASSRYVADTGITGAFLAALIISSVNGASVATVSTFKYLGLFNPSVQ